MRVVIRILRDAWLNIWGDLWTSLVCNLIWLLANLLIVPGPPATLALYYYSNLLAHGEAADLSDFWKAFRRYWGPAWRWGSINLGITAFLFGDFLLTRQFDLGRWGFTLQGLYLTLLASWLVVQFFALPFLFEQETLSVRQALRNSAVLIGRNPGFTIALTGTLLLILFVGTVVFMLSFAFGAVMTACAGNHAVLDRLETIKQPQPSL